MVAPVQAAGRVIAIAVAIEAPAIAATAVKLRSCPREAVRRAELLHRRGVQVELLPVMARGALEGLQLQDLFQKASGHCSVAQHGSETGLDNIWPVGAHACGDSAASDGRRLAACGIGLDTACLGHELATQAARGG